jgi:antitoxin MazE
MRTTIIKIGNSRGIRIPKPMLEESGILRDVNISVNKRGIRLTPLKPAVDLASETSLLSENTLSKDWDRPEEDAAWANL